MKLGIWDFQPSYDDSFEYFCFLNCYKNIMQYYQIAATDLYIDAAVEYRISETTDSSAGIFSVGDPNSSLLDDYKGCVVIEDDSIESRKVIWEKNFELINKGIPLVVNVDVFFLPYTPYYLKKHSIHSLIMCGFSLDKRNIDIIDWYSPWFYKGQILFKDLEKARNSNNERDGILSGNPIRHRYSYIKTEGLNADEDELIKIILGKSERNFYSLNAKEGYNALINVAGRLDEYKSVDKEKQSNMLENLYEELYFVPARKRLWQWYLHKAYEWTERQSFKLLFDEISVNIKKWKNVQNLIIKCSFRKDTTIYYKLLEVFLDVLENERMLYAQQHKVLKLLEGVV